MLRDVQMQVNKICMVIYVLQAILEANDLPDVFGMDLCSDGKPLRGKSTYLFTGNIFTRLD